MYLPAFALRQIERDILVKYLNRPVNIQLKASMKAYIIDENQFEEILSFVDDFSSVNEEAIDEAGAPSKIPNNTRAGVLRAVTAVFNLIIDAQKITDQSVKTATMAGILASVTSIMVMSPDYGQRLISILKSKL